MKLTERRGNAALLDDVYRRCKEQEKLPDAEMKNLVREIYDQFSDEEISAMIAEMLRPSEVKAEVKIVYQSLEGHRASCPGHHGDWYFSGDYPTPGGLRRLNRAYIDYYEGRGQKL